MINKVPTRYDLILEINTYEEHLSTSTHKKCSQTKKHVVVQPIHFSLRSKFKYINSV